MLKIKEVSRDFLKILIFLKMVTILQKIAFLP